MMILSKVSQIDQTYCGRAEKLPRYNFFKSLIRKNIPYVSF